MTPSVRPIDIIAWPHVFSQRKLLDPNEFGRAASDRGVRFVGDDLAILHRSRVLVPAYVVRRPRWDLFRRMSMDTWTAKLGQALWSAPKDGAGLAEDHAAGLVRDGLDVRFRPYDGDRVSTSLETVRRREYLYSEYQLLGLHSAQDALQMLRRPLAIRTRWERRTLIRLRATESQSRSVVALLTALEPRYLPGIVGHYTTSVFEDEDEWPRYFADFDPVAALKGLGWAPEGLYDAARDLVFRASMIDPLDAWLDLVSEVHPDRWMRLRGAARLAIDHRIAGELIFRFLEQLQRRDAAPSFPDVPRFASHELNMRLRPDRSRLDDVLMNYDLSPHPASVIVLEGATEMTLAPLVMDVLGISRAESFIRLVDAGGEGRDHRLLATYVASPRLGPREGEAAEYARPPTRYVIAVDADRAFRDPATRERERQKWVSVLYESLPTAFQTDASRADLDSMVVLEVWADGLDFERAHFSDEELADAILASGCAPVTVTRSALVAGLTHNRSRGDSLAWIWRDWRPQPSKPQLAMLLWPVLKLKLERRMTDVNRLREIPIGRVLLDASDLAARTPRRHVLLHVGPMPPADEELGDDGS